MGWAETLPSPRDHDAPLIFTDEQAQILIDWYTFDPLTYRDPGARRLSE